MATTLLTTTRLALREMTEADATHVFRLNSAAEVVQYVGEPVLASERAALEILRTHILPQYRTYRVGRWAVELKDNATFIGWCGLKYVPEDNAYDLGYRFMKDYWGKGYATEAAQEVLHYARRHLGGARIVGKALLDNTPSIRVLEKIGMCFEGYSEEHGGTAAVYVVTTG